MPNSLEQQAMERVARMYGSFDRRQPQQGRPQPPHRPDPPPRPEPPEPDPEPRPEPPAKPSGLLDQLMEDKEQSLLLLLLVILMKDGADMNTVLALMYLLI